MFLIIDGASDTMIHSTDKFRHNPMSLNCFTPVGPVSKLWQGGVVHILSVRCRWFGAIGVAAREGTGAITAIHTPPSSRPPPLTWKVRRERLLRAFVRPPPLHARMYLKLTCGQ